MAAALKKNAGCFPYVHCIYEYCKKPFLYFSDGAQIPGLILTKNLPFSSHSTSSPKEDELGEHIGAERDVPY